MKTSKSSLTPKLCQNWLIDALLGLSAILTVLSSLYFLAFPVSGYQGGRNPYYQQVLIFDRQSWDIIHTWAGVGMILIALWHILIHWGWITGTAKRVWRVMIGKRVGFGRRLTYNILLDAVVALSFVVCAVTGIYFLFFVHHGSLGQNVLFDRTTWDLIHTWSGVVMTISAILHFVLHWKWVVRITTKMFGRHHTTSQYVMMNSKLDQA